MPTPSLRTAIELEKLPCYYQQLGLALGVSERDVKVAYRKLARAYHPDRTDSDLDADERKKAFQVISNAHEVLSNPKDKELYDTSGSISAYIKNKSYYIDAAQTKRDNKVANLSAFKAKYSNILEDSFIPAIKPDRSDFDEYFKYQFKKLFKYTIIDYANLKEDLLERDANINDISKEDVYLKLIELLGEMNHMKVNASELNAATEICKCLRKGLRFIASNGMTFSYETVNDLGEKTFVSYDLDAHKNNMNHIKKFIPFLPGGSGKWHLIGNILLGLAGLMVAAAATLAIAAVATNLVFPLGCAAILAGGVGLFCHLDKGTLIKDAKAVEKSLRSENLEANSPTMN